MKIRSALLVLMASWMTAAYAHHSFAMFDLTRKVAVKGTVTRFEWSNPHVWIQLNVPNASGSGAVEWAVEAPAIAGLARVGWHSDSLKPGDAITVYLHPLKNGGPGGALADVVLADGTKLGQTGIQKERDQSGVKVP